MYLEPLIVSWPMLSLTVCFRSSAECGDVNECTGIASRIASQLASTKLRLPRLQDFVSICKKVFVLPESLHAGQNCLGTCYPQIFA